MKRTDPTKSLLSKDFEYVHSTRTDIRELFARIRAQQRPAENVKQINARKQKA